jgi:hypothetical protein
MRSANNQNQEQAHNRYIHQLREELRFLWQDANESEEEELRERKFNQYWELYRFYRRQREFLSDIQAEQ